MRILLCTKNDLPALVAANVLADTLTGHDVTIWLSDKTRQAERDRADLDLIRFFERELPLRWLLPTAGTEEPYRSDRFVGFEALARRLGGTDTIVPRLSTVAPLMRAMQPDLVLSIRFSHIFPADLIAIPRHGILNVHPGYLPEFGGLFTPFHQMASGQSRIGCTLHFIDEGIDTGPIVDVASIPIDPARSLQWHVTEIYPAAFPALARAIDTIDRGEPLAATPQDPAERRYYRMPDDDEIHAFQRRFRLVSPADFGDIMARFGIGPVAAAHASLVPPRAATC